MQREHPVLAFFNDSAKTFYRLHLPRHKSTWVTEGYAGLQLAPEGSQRIAPTFWLLLLDEYS